MRKLWELRRMFVPQIVSIVCIYILFAASTTKARAGVGIIAKTITDKYGQEVTVKTNSDEFDLETLVTRTGGAQLTSKTGANFKQVTKSLQFDRSVHAALSKMSLSPDAIRKWIELHPKTTLREVEKMSSTMQAKVANIATFIRSVNGKIDKKTAWREAAAIVHYCAKYNISTELAVGVAKAESTFNPDTVSKSGARGVMQIMWKYHAGMLQAKGIAASQEQLFDPERGIEAGILLLSRYVDAYGSIQKALNRYYGNVSTTYVKKIDKNVAMLEKHSSSTGF